MTNSKNQPENRISEDVNMTDLDKKIDDIFNEVFSRTYFKNEDGELVPLYDDNGVMREKLNQSVESLVKEEAERHADRVLGNPLPDHFMIEEVVSPYDDAFEQGSELTIKLQRQRNNYQVKGRE